MKGMITAVVHGTYRSYNIRLKSGRVLRHVPETISGKLIMKKVG